MNYIPHACITAIETIKNSKYWYNLQELMSSPNVTKAMDAIEIVSTLSPAWLCIYLVDAKRGFGINPNYYIPINVLLEEIYTNPIWERYNRIGWFNGIINNAFQSIAQDLPNRKLSQYEAIEYIPTVTFDDYLAYLFFVAIGHYKGSGSSSIFWDPNRMASDRQALGSYAHIGQKACSELGIDCSKINKTRKLLGYALHHGFSISGLEATFVNNDLSQINIQHRLLANVLIQELTKRGVPNDVEIYSGSSTHIPELRNYKYDKKRQFFSGRRFYYVFAENPFRVFGFDVPKDPKKLLNTKFPSLMEAKISVLLNVDNGKDGLIKFRKNERYLMSDKPNWPTRSFVTLDDLKKYAQQIYMGNFSNAYYVEQWNPTITGHVGDPLRVLGSPSFEKEYQDVKERFDLYIERMTSLTRWLAQNRGNLNQVIPKRKRFLHSFTLKSSIAERFMSNKEMDDTSEDIPTILVVRKGDAKKTVNIVTKRSSEDEILVLGENYTIYDAAISEGGVLLLYVKFLD